MPGSAGAAARDARGGPGPWALAAAFLAVYLIWGSTYLAIRVAIEDIPPLLMAGLRYLLAGGVLYGVLRAHGEAAPTRGEWSTATLLGGLMFLGGNGGVVLASQWAPSGLVALLVAMVPVWVVVLDALTGGGRPRPAVIAGVAAGFVGVAVLGRTMAAELGPLALLGAALVVAGALAWSVGTLRTRRGLGVPRAALLGVSMQFLAGGVLLTLAGAATGEVARFDPGAVTVRGLLAMLFLVVPGSMVAYTAYVWLLRHVPAPRVATYAFVNPVVAVLLGAWLASEPVTPATAAAGALIVLGVALITLGSGADPAKAPGVARVGQALAVLRARLPP